MTSPGNRIRRASHRFGAVAMALHRRAHRVERPGPRLPRFDVHDGRGRRELGAPDPRPPDVWPRAENERVLAAPQGRLPPRSPTSANHHAGPDRLPALAGTTAVTVDPTKEPTWNIDKDNPTFVASFARTLARLHGIDPSEAAAAGLKVATPDEARRALRRRSRPGETRDRHRRPARQTLADWLDDDASWPPFTALVHGDLHVDPRPGRRNLAARASWTGPRPR